MLLIHFFATFFSRYFSGYFLQRGEVAEHVGWVKFVKNQAMSSSLVEFCIKYLDSQNSVPTECFPFTAVPEKYVYAKQKKFASVQRKSFTYFFLLESICSLSRNQKGGKLNFNSTFLLFFCCKKWNYEIFIATRVHSQIILRDLCALFFTECRQLSTQQKEIYPHVQLGDI